jgi:hypothetical protein
VCIVVVRLWVLSLDRGFDVARLLRLWRRVCLCRLGGREGTAAWGGQLCRCRHVYSTVMLWMRVFRRRRRRPSSSSFAWDDV